jgi:transposase
MNATMIGIDLAKSTFQLHGIDAAGRVVLQKRLKRGQVERHFASHPPAVVGLEACAGAHYWARLLRSCGHEVRLMPPAYVKPYVKRNKTDSRDAEAICEAMQRPTMRFVPIKSEEQQAIASVHRVRAQLVRQRTSTANTLRSILAEFGIVAAAGTKGLRSLLAMLDGECPLPPRAVAALQRLARQWEALDRHIRELEVEIVCAARDDQTARRVMTVPGIGPIGASAIAAAVPDARVFDSGRDFAAWLGLTPNQGNSAGKTHSGRISKKGDRVIRTLLILGASARLARKPDDPWIKALLARRPFKVAAVALAAKMARIVWALLAKGGDYRARLPRTA